MQFWKSVMDGFAKGLSAGHLGVWCKGSYLQIQTGEKLCEKGLWDVCIPLRDLYLFSHKAVFEHCSCKTEKVTFCSTLKTMAKSEISWNKTQKEGFQETVLWRVHSFQRVKVYTTFPRLETLSLKNLWRDIKRRLEACGEKWNAFRWKLDRIFRSNCFAMCVCISKN